MTEAPKVSKDDLRSTEGTSYAKEASPDGQLKGPQSKAEFETAAKPSAAQSAQGKAAEPKPAPQQHHQPKGPGANTVTQQAAESRMSDFHAEQSDQNKALIEKADSINSRNESKAHDKIKGKDDLQK